MISAYISVHKQTSDSEHYPSYVWDYVRAGCSACWLLLENLYGKTWRMM